MRLNEQHIALEARDFFLLLQALSDGGDCVDLDLLDLRRLGPAFADDAVAHRIPILTDRLGISEGHEHYAAEGFARVLADSDLQKVSRARLEAAARGSIPQTGTTTLEVFEARAAKLFRRSPTGLVNEAFGEFTSSPDGPEYRPWLDLKPLTRIWPRELLESPTWNRIESPVPGIPDQPLEDTWVHVTLAEFEPKAPTTLGSQQSAAWRDLQFDYESSGLSAHELLLQLRGLSVVVGEPGAGKSTLIKWLARHVVAEPSVPFGIPVLVNLRQFARTKIEQPNLSLFEYFLRSRGVDSDEQIERWKTTRSGLEGAKDGDGFEADAFIWLLDGWDEVPRPQRADLMADLESVAFLPSVVTTRFSGDPLLLPARNFYRIQGLKHSGALELAHRWLTSVGRGDYFLGIENLLEESPQVRRMARSPFLLTLICALAVDPEPRPSSGTGWLPRRRSSILGETLRLVYAQHDQDLKQRERFTSRDREQIARFALWLFTTGREGPRYVFEPADYGRFISDGARFEALLVPSRLIARVPLSLDDYQFLHANFQELLAANGLCRSPDTLVDWSRLILDRSWQEVARFLAEKKGSADVDSAGALASLWQAARRALQRRDRFGLLLSRVARLLAAAGERDGGERVLGADLRHEMWTIAAQHAQAVPTDLLEAFVELDPTDLARRILDDRIERGSNTATVQWLGLVSIFDLEKLEGHEPYRETLDLPEVACFCQGSSERSMYVAAAGDEEEVVPSLVLEMETALETRDLESIRSIFWAMVDQHLNRYTYECVARFPDLPSDFAVEILVQTATGGPEVDTLTRAEAVIGLMRLGDREAKDRLVLYLASLEADDLRVMPILGNLRGHDLTPQQVRLVTSFFDHPDPETRIAAAEVFSGTRNRAAAQRLIETASTEDDDEARQCMLALLEDMAVDSHLEALWELRHADVLRTPDDWTSWFRSVLAAAEYRQERAQRLGVRSKDQGGTLRAIRSWALKSLATGAEDLSSPRGQTLEAALRYSKFLGSVAIDPLIRLAVDERLPDALRARAMLGLASVGRSAGNRDVLEALERLAKDRDGPEEVARAACEALGDLDPTILPGISTEFATETMATLAFRRHLLFVEGHVLDARGRPLGDTAAAAIAVGEEMPEIPALAPPLSESVGELTIRMSIESDSRGSRLCYQLDSEALGWFEREVAGPKLLSSPQEFQARLLRRAEALGKKLDREGARLSEDGVRTELVKLGRWLYESLFSDEMRRRYLEFRERVSRIWIVSDEPYIPWELLKPYDARSKPAMDDDFLCLRFEITRWLRNAGYPARRIPVRAMAAVEAGRAHGQKELHDAVEELAWLKRFAAYRGLEDRSLSGDRLSRDALVRLLETGDLQLLHYIGHGDFDPDAPESSALFLPDGTRFEASELTGPAAAGVQSTGPFVFLNTCSGGQLGFALTALDGWAPAFVRAGCGAFLGSQWTIRSTPAVQLARNVYTGVASGRVTLPRAVRQARHSVKRTSLLAALSPVLYGHPQGRLTFPGDVAESDDEFFSPRVDP